MQANKEPDLAEKRSRSNWPDTFRFSFSTTPQMKNGTVCEKRNGS
jgi:hypothetical protein